MPVTGKAGLSPREHEVLHRIAQGKRTKEISQELGISRSTVRTHLRQLFRKLEASNRVDAVMKALRDGILDLRLVFLHIDKK